MDKDRTVIDPGLGLTVWTMVSTTIGEGEITIITIVIGIIGPQITEIAVGLETETVMAMAIKGMIDMIAGQLMGEIILGKTMGTKGIEIGVQVRTMGGLGKDIEVIHEIIQIQEIDTVTIETKAVVEIGDKGLGLSQGTETEKIVEQGLDQAHM